MTVPFVKKMFASEHEEYCSHLLKISYDPPAQCKNSNARFTTLPLNLETGRFFKFKVFTSDNSYDFSRKSTSLFNQFSKLKYLYLIHI